MSEPQNPFELYYQKAIGSLQGMRESPCNLDRKTPNLAQANDADFRLVGFPNLLPFHRSLHKVSQRFDFIDTSDERWESDYVRPDALSHWTDQFNWTDVDEPNVINASPETEARWFASLIDSGSPNRTNQKRSWLRYFVTGEIGCGKSTFIKRGIRKNKSDFHKNKLIPTRVEFSKVGRSTTDADETPFEELRLATIDAMYREIQHFFCNAEKGEGFTAHREFSKFRRYVVDTYIYSSDDENYKNLSERAENFADYNIAKASRFTQLSRNNKKFEIYNTSQLFKEIAVRYTIDEAGYNFVVIFDGFDYLTAADYLFKTKESARIEQLNTIYKGSTEYSLLRKLKSPIDIHQIFVMRDITYGRFFSRKAGIDEFDERSHFRIVSPGSKALVARAVSRVCEECGLPNLSAEAWEFDKFVRRLLREVIVKGDSEQGEASPSKNSLAPLNVFNGNARKELDYLRLVIEFLVLEIIADPKSNFADSPRELFQAINDPRFRRDLTTKKYRLLALLLCRDRSAFRNSLALPNTQSASESIYDSQGLGHVIDNLYNYDEANQQPCALLSKIRVCELLRDNPLSIDEISNELGDAYCTDFDRLIAVMCRTGLLKSRFKNGNVFFQTESVGLVCIDHLIHKTEYIENVFPHISLPNPIRDLSIRAYDRTRSTSKHWARASLINTFLLLKYIQDVEEIERSTLGKNWNWISPRIQSHHHENCCNTLIKFDPTTADGGFHEELESRLFRNFGGAFNR